MTTQEKIRRLASEVLDVPTFPRTSPHPVIAGPPFAIRKTPICSECAANAPIGMMVPMKVAFYQEARTLFMDRSRGTNHRRRPRPSLASAVCCLLASTGAVVATSPRGEEWLADMVPVLMELGSDAKTMVVSGAPQGLAQAP